jgi:hypothetical protein
LFCLWEKNSRIFRIKGTLIVSPGIEPGGIVFPSQNNNIVLHSFGVLQTMWELEIFSSGLDRR